MILMAVSGRRVKWYATDGEVDRLSGEWRMVSGQSKVIFSQQIPFFITSSLLEQSGLKNNAKSITDSKIYDEDRCWQQG
jgi:hypothetical protein